MSAFQITRKLASDVKDSSSDVFIKLSDQLGGSVLKEEQKLAVEALLSGKDVMAVLPTGFGKSYQSFVIAKSIANTTSIVVVVQLRGIIEDQFQSNDFNIKAVAFEKIPKLSKDIGANKYNVIFASRNKLCRQNSPQDA